MHIKAVGVHPVEAPEPCHVIELLVTRADPGFDVGRITQPTPGLSKEEWQVPWDERFLNLEGTAPIDQGAPDRLPSEADYRVVFFFHYLDPTRPLDSPSGSVELPQPTPLPRRLKFVEYESPC